MACPHFSRQRPPYPLPFPAVPSTSGAKNGIFLFPRRPLRSSSPYVECHLLAACFPLACRLQAAPHTPTTTAAAAWRAPTARLTPDGKRAAPALAARRWRSGRGALTRAGAATPRARALGHRAAPWRWPSPWRLPSPSPRASRPLVSLRVPRRAVFGRLRAPPGPPGAPPPGDARAPSKPHDGSAPPSKNRDNGPAGGPRASAGAAGAAAPTGRRARRPGRAPLPAATRRPERRSQRAA